MNEIVKKKEQLPMSPAMQETMAAIKENLSAVGNFKIPRIRATASGLQVNEDEEPFKTMEGVLIYARKTKAYYASGYTPGESNPPDCFSHDWVKPASDVATPQAATCKECGQNKFGSNNMKSGKACRDLRPLYFLEIIKEGKTQQIAPIPQMLLVTPTSLKALDGYLMNLTQKMKHFRSVVTKVEWRKENPKDTYGVLSFSVAAPLPPEIKADADALLNMWAPYMDAQVIDQADVGEAETTANVEEKGGEF